MPDFSEDGIPDSLFQNINHIVITACGTAMHAGLIGKNMIERLTRIPVTVDIASEFRYQDPILDEHTPEMDERFSPFASAVVLQYIAYYTAVARGLNVDHPRNLAKSVTVE